MAELEKNKEKQNFTPRNDSGLLIVFEGLDGAGKSTQVKRLAEHLKSVDFPVVVTKWNSSKYISRATKRAKRAQLLTPNTFSALHATDFFHRLENIIIPSLAAGKIVIADRYSYTAIARGNARGIDTNWVSHIFSLAVEPDIVFLCDLPVEIALKRVMEKHSRPPNYYEAGMDVSGEVDPMESFKDFQNRVAEKYANLVEKGQMIPIDVDRPEEEIFAEILEFTKPYLDKLHAGKEFVTSSLQQKTHMDWFTQTSKINSVDENYSLNFPKHNYPGKLIVFEGVHRAGVTHQINLLFDWLQVRGVEVVKSGLGSTWITSEITERALRNNSLSPRTNVLLNASEISYVLEVEVLPALKRGATVLLNRYLLTTFVEGLLRSIDPEWLMKTLAGLGVSPDLTIYMDVSFDTLLDRVDLSNIWEKESLHAGLDIGFTRDVETSFDFYQRRALSLYHKLAEGNDLPTLDGNLPPEQNFITLSSLVAKTINMDTENIFIDSELQEVLELYHSHNGYFEHTHKVQEFAVQIFDATIDLHGLGRRPRKLLEYAALLHDIGHFLGNNHEENSYKIIMNHNFSSLSTTEKRLVALISLYHNGPIYRLDKERQVDLRAEEQLAARKLAGILRLADALDSSNKQVVTRLRIVREKGAIILDINSVGPAKAERRAVLSKCDLFERYFDTPVLIDRNRTERIARRGSNSRIDLYS